ncbi:AraC family transcriptional regulator [Ferrimonas sp. SCSIO 43195]|uniref:helix-turn-helix domain-containing protein n=1 Tax=Ferrimonas sp. SCSIO 43195 TaxID=2822844 RepID=UPI0020751CE7|nr:AraC family transcriptional regulator [Ferrimonas sp. SCSIO 43195]USD37316.1 helix-turn-helix domain-containing protein [Ferrimonas sp. SCSIO 43195]
MPSSKDNALPLRNINFNNPRLRGVGLEPMTLSELKRKVSADFMIKPERVHLYMLILVTAGQGRHRIDFEDWPMAPGTLVCVRPGQVQQWLTRHHYDADIVLIAPDALPYHSGQQLPQQLSLLRFDEWHTLLSLSPDDAAQLGVEFTRLRHDFEQFDGDELDAALIRHELMSLLLRVARLQRRQQQREHQPERHSLTYRLFRQALERQFLQQRQVQYYAQSLGYSASTLSRACLAAEGRSAKQVIDRRTALEAQRLLAHSTASVAEVGHQLGFSETTNFIKFFRRLIGVTPKAFRQQK